MEPVAIFLVFLVLALIVFYVSRPFFERSSRRAVESSQETSTLLAEREQILNALQELDFDQTLGKIPEEDYPVQRRHYCCKKVPAFSANWMRLPPALVNRLAKRTRMGGVNP